MVNKVVGMNGKPFDASEFDDENRKAVERMLFDVADAVDTGEHIPRALAITLLGEDGEPTFWFAGKETDSFLIYGALEAMRQTFWEAVVKGDGE